MYEIRFTPEAISDLHLFKKHDRKRIIDEIERGLTHQPTRETRNNKRLRPNQVAEWELRVDRFRVFYDIDEVNRVIKVEAVGHKHGSRLFIHGEEYTL